MEDVALKAAKHTAAVRVACVRRVSLSQEVAGSASDWESQRGWAQHWGRLEDPLGRRHGDLPWLGLQRAGRRQSQG